MDNTLFADGFEDALIGYFDRCGQPTVAVYDYEKAVRILMERDGLGLDEAIEHMDFNVTGGWVGDGTPAFIHLSSDAELKEMLCPDKTVPHPEIAEGEEV